MINRVRIGTVGDRRALDRRMSDAGVGADAVGQGDALDELMPGWPSAGACLCGTGSDWPARIGCPGLDTDRTEDVDDDGEGQQGVGRGLL